jgi:hypothetical protein
VTYQLVAEPDAVAGLSAQVSREAGLPAAHIEKDFWITEVLRGVVAAAAAESVEVLFKGGTSLSKAFGLIKRFSEDVDVLVIFPPGGHGARDTLLKHLVQGAADATLLAPVTVPEATGKGEKRGTRFYYGTENAHGAGLSDGVFLEIGSRGGAMPTSVMPIQSLLALHAPERLADAAEAAPMSLRVLSPARALIEKLVLLHTAHCGDDPAVAIKGARHFYDVHQLLGQAEIIGAVAEVGVAIMARDVCTYSEAAQMAAQPRPAEGFAVSPAFGGGKHLGVVREEYERRVLGQLLWPGAERPSFDDCIEAVHQHAHRL